MTAVTAKSQQPGIARSGWAGVVPSWRHSAVGVRNDQLLTAAVGVGSAVIGASFALFGRGTAAAVWVGLVTLCVTPGCAFACWHLTRDRLTRLIAVLGASLTWTTLVTTLLAWLQVTNLEVLIVATAEAGGLGSAVFLLYQLTYPVNKRQHEQTSASGRLPYDRRAELDPDPMVDTRPDWRYDPGPRHGFHPGLDRRYHPVPNRRPNSVPDPRQNALARGPRALGAAHSSSYLMPLMLLALTFAAALWITSVTKSRGHYVGVYGLLPLLGVPFTLAVIVTIGVLAVALWSIRSAWPAAVVALGLLLVELNGTPMFLTVTPLGNLSTYEHFGVIDYILHGGPLNDPLDVYQQWPGFFAAVAGLTRLTGESPLTYSNWAQLFFEALNAVVLFGIARRFSRGRQVIPYVTVLLFETVSWEGQFYFAPQTMAFTMTLFFLYFLLPLLETGSLRRPFASRDWLRVPPLDIAKEKWVHGVNAVPLAVGLLAVFAAITVMHQLSPYFILVSVAGLWILGVFRRTRVVAALAMVLIGYALVHYGALSHNQWLTGFSLNGTTSAYPASSGPEIQLASKVSEATGSVFWLITGICALSYRRRIGLVAIPIILAATPFSLVLANSYGGEAVNRVFLFSSPWCALIIAMRLGDLPREPMLRWTFLGVWALLAALGSAQVQDFGLFSAEQITPGEIQASAYFLDHAPPNSMLVLAVPDFPARVNRRYVLHNTTQTVNDPLASDIDNCDAPKSQEISSISPAWCHYTTDPQALAISVTTRAQGSAYLVISPSMYRYVDYSGVLAPGSLSALIPRLKASPYWKIWYDDNGVTIFQAFPRGKPEAQVKNKEKG